LSEHTREWSAAAYASLRREIAAYAQRRECDEAAIMSLVEDRLLPPLHAVRRRQTLLALVNCTRRSLLPDPQVDDTTRAAWHEELAQW
ncbi:MAG: hypothetical protein EA401_12340, partial [Planctomycetota bacterium]